MSLRIDYIDWLEGFPFEVAAPDRVLRVLARSGFGERVDCKLPGGMNEQVAHRSLGRFPPNRRPFSAGAIPCADASAVTGRRRATPRTTPILVAGTGRLRPPPRI